MANSTQIAGASDNENDNAMVQIGIVIALCLVVMLLCFLVRLCKKCFNLMPEKNLEMEAADVKRDEHNRNNSRGDYEYNNQNSSSII